MKLRHFTTMRTEFGRDECNRRLLESIDIERPTIFSFSGYRGSRPLIGQIEGYRFYLHKRRYWRNDFAPKFYGHLVPRDRGTLIEGYFDMPRWTKFFMRIWLGIVVLIGGPLFVMSLAALLKGREYVEGDPRIGLWVPPFMVLVGILLPKTGLWLGRNEERFMLEFLQRTLVARVTTPS